MNDIPIYDSLTHPTLDKNWIMPGYPGVAGIDRLIAGMDENNISHALAVGMKDIGRYEDSEFIKLIESCHGRLIPIAFFDLNDQMTVNEMAHRLKRIKAFGFKGIKLHPRLSGFTFKHPLLIPVIKQANEFQLCVLLCTYFYDQPNNARFNFMEKLPNTVYKLEGAKLILLHGGSVRLLETIEIVRSYGNVLLDLSFTLCKFQGSSLDMDIQFAFNSFDKRICIGSDFPEFSPNDLRERFNAFAKNIARNKAENIAFRNIKNFLS